MRQSMLIIDDAFAIQDLLRVRLKDEQLDIHYASSGEAGLAMCKTLKPDLVLLDVDMPQPDGFEVCRQIRADPNLANTQVIFLTGASSTQEKIRGLDLGALDYITKPFETAELHARVHAALRMCFMIDLLARKAQIDALTGLWNRGFFDDRLTAELSRASRRHTPMAVIMLDVDRFKLINDTFGHPAGDQVLRALATVLAESVRAEDIVCRYGGEEFALIIPDAGESTLLLAERLRESIAAISIPAGGKTIRPTVSLGVAMGEDPAIVARADAALYRAKETGRNRVEHAAELLAA